MPDPYWHQWTTSNSYNITSSTSSTIDLTWSNWNNSTSTGGNLWQTWNTNSTTTTFGGELWLRWTEQHDNRIGGYFIEQEHVSQEQRRSRRRENGIRQAKVYVAKQKADRLLRSLLTAEQIQMMEEEQRFFVMGQSGKMYEVLTDRRQHNVFEVCPNGNRRMMEFCIVAPHVPDADHFAAQVLMLKTEEQEFYRQSNVWRLEEGGSKSIVQNAERQLTVAEERSLVAA